MLRTKLAILAIAATGFAASQEPHAAPAKPEAAPVIVRIVGRDTTITVRAGAASPVYSVESKTGEQLVAPASLETLEAQNPQLARKVQAMQAGAWAGVE